MIYSNITLTVTAGVSRTNERIILYRGDREVEVIFEILQSAFKFAKGENVIENTKAAFGQLIIDRPDKDFIFSEMTECEDGKVKFVITGEMIDDLGEVGLYGIQIRLYDEAKTSRITLPPVMDAIEVREPISEEPTTIDEAIIDYSMVARGGIVEDPFDDSDSYNKTNWVSGDKITAVKMNKLENAMYEVNEKVEGIAIPSLDGYATKNYVDSAIDEVDVSSQLGDYAKLSQVPTKTSQLVNDSGFLTEAPDLSNYVTNASLKGVENAYKAADTTLQNNINALDAAYKAADTTLQNNINSLDAAYKAADVEIQNSIPTKTSQLENDAAYITEEAVAPNLIRNGIFAAKKTDYWWTFGEFWQWSDYNYYNEGDMWLANQKKRDISSWPGSRSGIFTNAISVEPGEVYTFSTQVLWEGEVEGIGVYIEFYYNGEYKQIIEYYGTNTNSGEREIFVSDITKRQSITFTIPSDVNEVMVGLIHEGCFNENPGRSYLVNFRFPCLKKGYSTEWTPHKYDICIVPEKGSWFNNGTPVVDAGGVMEIGKFLDFHVTNNSTSDYDCRVRVGSANHLHFVCNILPDNDGTHQIGTSSMRWNWINLKNNPTVSSDRVLKENITYVKSEKAKSAPTDEIVTYEDMYDFIKNDLELATYNFKGQEEQSMNFIAQDLLYNADGTDNKIGQMIINPISTPTEEEIAEAKSKLEEGQEYRYPTLSYDMGMYISVLAGALKEALNKIDKLEDEIKELKNK